MPEYQMESAETIENRQVAIDDLALDIARLDFTIKMLARRGFKQERVTRALDATLREWMRQVSLMCDLQYASSGRQQAGLTQDQIDIERTRRAMVTPNISNR